MNRPELKKIIPLIPFFYLGVYLLLPSGFSTTDAWHYAADIKYSTGLFHPFHLLYNVFGEIFCKIPSLTGADTLCCLKVMNAVFAALTLYMVVLIMKRAGSKEPATFITAALAGASFSVMRYATENETYILPLFFGISASYFFLRHLTDGKKHNLILSSFAVSVAVLMHLSYFIWWAGILAGVIIRRNKKLLLLFSGISLIVPLAYLMAIIASEGRLDLMSVKNFAGGRFDMQLFSVSVSGLLLSVISLIRSFIQVHGYMLNMVKSDLFFLVPGLLSVSLVLAGIIKTKEIRINNSVSGFIPVHILIAASMFLFAFFSEGNAEFMVMIPVLLFMITGISLKGCERLFFCLLPAMLIWNVVYGLIPLNKRSGESENFLLERLRQEGDALVIAYDDQLLAGMLFYNTGRSDSEKILQSPAVLKKKDQLSMLESVIEKNIENRRRVYTNCLSQFPLSRAEILQGRENKVFFSRYKTEEVMRWSDIDGIEIVHRLTGFNK